MTLLEMISSILKYASDEDKASYLGNVTVDAVYADNSGLRVCFTDGNTPDWVLEATT